MLIGLAGGRHVGKDTAGVYIAKHKHHRKFALADLLKIICAEAFEMSEYDFYDENVKEYPFQHPLIVTEYNAQRLVNELRERRNISHEQVFALKKELIDKQYSTPRQILQGVADAVKHNISPNFWIDILASKVDAFGDIVVTDVRYENERNFIKERGGKLILIKRKNAPSPGTHSSDNSLGSERQYDAIINNDGTEEELYRELDRAYECLLKGRKYRQSNALVVALRRLVSFFKRKNKQENSSLPQ